MGKDLIPTERIEGMILQIRGQKVMLDRDLALLYGVETKALKRAVKRNITRFPDDFMSLPSHRADRKHTSSHDWHLLCGGGENSQPLNFIKKCRLRRR
jgi:hypothetical protein